MIVNRKKVKRIELRGARIARKVQDGAKTKKLWYSNLKYLADKKQKTSWMKLPFFPTAFAPLQNVFRQTVNTSEFLNY